MANNPEIVTFGQILVTVDGPGFNLQEQRIQTINIIKKELLKYKF